MKNKIWVLIPAYNEQNTIAKIITQILPITKNILVIDDNSSDRTGRLVLAQPVTYLRNKKNLGYTKSLEKGLRYAFSHDAEYVISFDADGEHKPADLKKFISYINSLKPDLLIGNRSIKNRYLEHIFGKYTQFRFGISDPFCGFKAYKKSFFTLLGNKLEDEYSIGMQNIFRYLKKHPNTVIYKEINIGSKKRVDHSRFAVGLKGELLELLAAANILKRIYT